MKNNNGRQEYGINLNNAELRANVAESKRLLHGVGDSAIAEGARIDNSYKKLASTIATIGASVGVGMLAKQLYSFANNFSNSMAEVSTISATVTNDLDGFKQGILEMTTQIPVGADEAAKALYQIVSAGHDGAAGMQVMEVAAKAAIGGVTQTVTAADAITTVLNAYKKDASEAEGISDQLFTTVRLGKTTFGELGQSISQVVPIAASFGIETEQVLAAVATLTKSGTPTAQAMTQIRASIVAASKVLGDGYFQTHTFQEGLSEIANRAGGSESELRKLVPEIEAVNGVLGLTGINAKMAASDLAELGNSAGAAGRAYAKMNNQADAQLTILKNTILKKFHDIGEGAVDMVGGFAKLLNSDGVFNDKAIDDVIATLVVLIATVGMYKTSMLAANAIQRVSTNVQYAAEIAELQKLLPAKQASADADIHQAFAKGRITEATAERLIAIRAEVAAELEGLKVKALAAQKELEAAIQADKNALRRSVIAKQNLALSQSQMQIALQGGSAEEIADAKTSARTAKIEVNSAARARNTAQQAIGTAQTQVAATATALDTMQTNVNTASTNAGTTAKNLFTAATARLTKAFHSLKVAFATNPIGMILTGVTMAISLFSMFGNKIGSVADKSKALAASIDGGVNKALADETAKLQSLRRQLSETEPSSKKRIDLIKELKREYPDIIGNIDAESAALDKVIGSIDNYISKLKDKIRLQVLEQKYFQNIKDVEDAKISLATGGDRDDYDKVTKRVRLENALILDQLEYQQNLVKYSKEYADLQKEKKSFGDVEVVSMLPRNPESKIDYENKAKAFEDAAKREGKPFGKLEPYEEYLKRFEKNLVETDEKATRLQIVNNRIAEIEKETPVIAGGGGVTSGQASKAAKDYSDEKIAEMLELERMKIDLLEDGRAKELAQIEQTKDEKLAAIQKEQNEIAAEIAKGGLTKEQKTARTERSGALEAQKGLVNQLATQDSAKVNEKYNKEIAKKEQELTDVMLSETQRRNNALKTKYAELREWSDTAFAKGSDEHKTFNLKIDTSQAFESNKSMLKEYEDFAQQYLGKAEEFKSNLKRIESELQAEREQLVQSGASKKELQKFDKQAKLQIEAVNTTQTEMLEQLDEQIGIKSETFVSFLEGIANAGLEELILKLSEAEALLAAAKLDPTEAGYEKVGQYQAQIAALKQQLLNAKKQDKASDDKTDPARKHKATLKAVTELGKASQDIAESFDGLDGNISDIIKSAGKLSSSIGSLLASIVAMSTASQITVTTTSIAGVTAITTVSATASTAIQSVEKASVILAIIGAAIQIVMAIVEALEKVFNEDDKKQEAIENWQKSIDGLEKQYDTLAKSIEKAYSQSAAGLIEQQNKLLEDQKKLIEQQKEAERSKKDPDDGALDSYDDKLNEINEKIAENNEKAIDAIFGSDLKSAIDDFASAYLDAWSAGEDRAEAQKDVVKKMIQGIVSEIIKGNIAEKVADLRTALKDAIIDGVIDETEQAAIDKLQEEIYAKSEKDAKAYEKWMKDDEDAQNDKSMAGQIRGSVATEASVSELGGLFRSQTDSLLRIDSKMDLGFGHLLEIARSNAAVEHNTAMIAANTAQTVAMLAGGFSSMQIELQAINKNTSKDGGSYGN